MELSFRPEFEGEFAADRMPDDFLLRMDRRVRTGLFGPGQSRRARYRVIASSRESLEFAAADLLTAWNVGLNEVRLRRTGPTVVTFHVRFARWTRYAVLLGATLGAAIACLYVFLPTMRSDVAAYSYGPVLFWGMVVFWGIAWPWVLTALHRPFARKALEQILREELARGGEALPDVRTPGA